MKINFNKFFKRKNAVSHLDLEIARAKFNDGLVLHQKGRLLQAKAIYEQVIGLQPQHFDALHFLGVIAMQSEDYLLALEMIDKAIAISSNNPLFHCNRGITLHELKRFDEALASYNQAIKLKTDYVEAYINRGITLKQLKKFEEALRSYDQAIRLNPDFAEAHYNRGIALQECVRWHEALASYSEAIKRKPDIEFLFGVQLHAKMQLCDWRDTAPQFAQLEEKIRRDEKTVLPFPALALTGVLSLQRRVAEIWVNKHHSVSPELGKIPKRVRRGKIRVGYYSADYHDHATAYLMAELFERHDKNRFELMAFSFGPDNHSEIRHRVSGAFDRFIDVRNKSDREIALLSRKIEIDIAVDLKGFTQDARSGIFAYKAAPLQVNYLGYPGTMGAEYIDYLIADRILIPEDHRQYYSEKVVYLPDSYQVNDRKRVIADRVFSREELGLPYTGFVFCCFNNSYKITPATFEGWMRILKRVGQSVLWLLEPNAAVVDNLRSEAALRGVDAARLIFAKRMPLAEHLARHRAADLFIDTLPYNAHTSASDALWAGLPVLTIIGEAFAGRVAASLLHAIGLPELVTTTQAQYEELAVELAARPQLLAQIRQKLERNRLTTPLFDAQRFTWHLEDAYTQMVERYQDDALPEDIYVNPRMMIPSVP